MLKEDVEYLLQARGLKKYFPITAGLIRDRVTGWIKALDGVDLCLRRQQTVGFVGESGSGKTTLAKVLLLLEKPTSGEVLFDGKNAHTLRGMELSAYRRTVQAVFQDPFSSLSPRLHIKDIIAEPLEVAGRLNKREQEIRVAEVLRMVGLDPSAMNLFPNELSGGQRQRVAIARAISTDSRIIILDEPTSALDVSIRLQIVHLLMELQRKLGHSYLLIGHDLAMVAYMATDIAVMYLGKIVEFAETKELLKNTLHPYTKALISAALPDHPREKTDRTMLSGEIASPSHVPTGCRFHPRCLHRKSICSEQEPPLVPVREDHLLACHFDGQNGTSGSPQS
jgi:oligopeptide/dipeptide ABC transporter ATP-binding protein